VVEAHPRYLVVDKGPGLLTHRTPHRADAALLDRLGARFGFVHPVHRLDQEVSGLLVFARDPEAAEQLRAQFRERTAVRRYVAAVQGVVSRDQGELVHHLAQNQGTYRMYPVAPGAGRRAVTHYWVLDRYPDATLLEVALQTGIKNQIRVQLALAGHPLLGEQKYAGASAIQHQRLFLHATLLGFVPPGATEGVEWQSPLPRDLVRWRDRLASGEINPRPAAAPASSGPRRRGWRPRRPRRSTPPR
jgi:23S rRNA pseudouridine1911/1915/1917 synthase